MSLVRRGVTQKEAQASVSRYFEWHVVDNTVAVIRDAFAEAARWKISFWDALIIAAAKRAGAGVLWTEDLNHGRDYGGIRVLNPLL